MSDLAKKLTDNAREKGALNDKQKFFSVTDKKLVDAGGGEMVEVRVPNGQHRVKIISEKIGMGKAFNGKEEQQLQMVVSDNGEQKEWNVSIKNQETGKLNYIVEALENIEIGEEFIVEAFKMKTGKYGSRISKVVSKRENIPTIQLDDQDSEGDNEKLPPLTSSEEDIAPASIPF